MTLAGFITSQQRLIAESNIDDYLPTLWVDGPTELRVNVLRDPPSAGLEVIARAWADQIAGEDDYFLAFKVDDSRIKVIARLEGVVTEQVTKVDAE